MISLKITFETEPAELEDHMDDLPLVEDLLNVEKSEILDTKSPSPTAPEEPLSLNCTDCDETFSTVSELRTHKKDIHGKTEKKFQCTVCDLICPNKSKLKTHTEEVHEKRKVPCPQCQKMFSKGGLRNHVKYYHDVDRISKVCTYLFDT